MKEVLVIEGREYRWLSDLLTRLYCGDTVGTLDDLDYVSGLLERTACCDRCENRYNEYTLEKIGYEKKGGVYVQA